MERRTRLLCAREIDTLDDPAWAEAITTVKQLILAGPEGFAEEWWLRLPPFSGASPDRPCAKCGSSGSAGTRWVRHVVRHAGCETPPVFGELLVRTCGRCGFEWHERLADAAQAMPESAADACADPDTEP